MSKRTRKTAAVTETPAHEMTASGEITVRADLASIEPVGEDLPVDPRPEGQQIAEDGTVGNEIGMPELPATLTPTELEAIAGLEEPTPVSEAPAEEIVEEPVATLEEALQAVDDLEVDEIVASVVANVDAREIFEKAKSPDNTNIQRTLGKVRNQLTTKRAARLLAVAEVSPTFLNREIHTGARYNVYAAGKLADVVYGVTEGGKISNAINLAILKSLFRFKAQGLVFTGEMAKAAASDKIKVEGPAKMALVRHNVDSGTAPTQASSTMTALETLGIVERSGTARAPVYALRDTPLVRKIREQLFPEALAA